ncbi:MAG: hypothetical protein HUJ22_12840 [Gracilimonas sp.]|uniref:hypothetical protein n=1 Tax=Gracilimonas sp. TaxID=1974203 RepID=UPI0019B8D474|nr:hypothetical protein [Gracilimonas sp.]MBD3617448.1 hypothetical protein [Gracilimonas sp.]
MKKSSTYLLAILIVTTLSFVSFDVHAQFNGTKLGMSLNEVQSIMGKENDITNDGTGIISHAYDDKLDRMDVRVHFRFIDDELVENTIEFKGPYSTEEFYLIYYDRINDILASKYGEAEKEINIFEHPISEYGELDPDSTYSQYFLLANNYIFYSTTWELPDMKVQHLMGGLFNDVGQMIKYTVPDYDQRVKNILKDKF